jgi:sialate O-acetylesterase
MHTPQIGAIIDDGPSDWQIIQQDARGFGRIALRGRWTPDATNAAGRVEARLVVQDTGTAVSRDTDWQPADTHADGSWSHTFTRIPAGGLYRLETRFHAHDNPAAEWSLRGDMRHCLGVGDVWIIAGQSNSAGYGRGAYHDPAELGVHLFRNNGLWALATHPMNESTDTSHSVNREGANPSHSPYLNFGRVLKHALGYPIGLVQTALGGSPLRRWNPGEQGEADLLANMLQCAQQAGGAVKGVLWYQGETDANELTADSYLKRFRAAVRAWRVALHNPRLPIVTAQLNRVFPNPPLPAEAAALQHRSWSMLREAQRQAARTIPAVFVVPTLDLPLSDLIHTSPAGNILLGERMARSALGGVHGRAVAHLAPDVSAATLSRNGSAITLRFDNVNSRIDTIERSAHGFRVEDSQGEVVIAAVEYPGGNTLRLNLARALRGRALVHGAYGCCPATTPVDMDRVLPMLGFYGLSVGG